MPTQKDFHNWLLQLYPKSRDAHGLVPAYPDAIIKISKHYSKNTEQNIDIYEIDDLGKFNTIHVMYMKGGKFADVGAAQNAQYRAALNKYRDFLHEIGGENSAAPPPVNEINDTDNFNTANNFSYERDLQNALCNQISQLFSGYNLQDREYIIGNRRIDVLLHNPADDSYLIIELKAGIAKREVFSQISEYMGLLHKKYPDKTIKGVIIAKEIGEDLRLAVLGTGTDKISLRTYAMSLALTKINAAES